MAYKNQNINWIQYKDKVQTMPLMPYSKTLVAKIARETGIPTVSVSRIHLHDLQARNHTLKRHSQTFPILLNEIAAPQLLSPESEQDPLLILWRIRGHIRKLPSSRPPIQLVTHLGHELYYSKYGSNTHKAMAIRAMSQWNSDTKQYQLCDQLLHEIYIRLTRQEALRPLEQSFWLRWYGDYLSSTQKQQSAHHINAEILKLQRRDARPR